MYTLTDNVFSNEELLKISNKTTFLKYFNQYMLLALNIFEWENLPETIQTKHIEKPLIEHGYAFFYSDPEYGYVCLPCSVIGLNIYNEPTTIQITTPLVSRVMNIEDGVLIYNNDIGYPLSRIILNYASRLSEIETSINTNIYQQKFPYIIQCDKKTSKSIEKMFENIHENEPLIMIKQELNLTDAIITDLNIPYVADKLLESKKEIENELLTLFGLNNVGEKKERLIVDEANANNDYINRNVDLLYKSRKIACEEINKKFGLNISVKRINNVDEKEYIEEGGEIDNE